MSSCNTTWAGHFQAYADAGFGEHMLPLIPHDAHISPRSPSHDGLHANRGKVPGKRTSNGWVGMKDWQDVRASRADLVKWEKWGSAIGMQSRTYPGLDIDVTDAGLAGAIHELAHARLGPAPCRFGRGARRLLVYACEGLAKRRLAFRRTNDRTAEHLPSSTEHAITGDAPRLEPAEAVELLGDGQQYAVEGVHPKAGKPYWWAGGQSPADWGSENLTPISEAALDDFFQEAGALVVQFGYEATISSSYSRRTGEQWQEGHLAPSIEAIGRALAAVPNEVDYDTWIKVGAAVKAAGGPERVADALDLWMEWSLQWPGNDMEGVAAKWATFRSPFRVGWAWLSWWATQESGGAFQSAHEDFPDAVREPPKPGVPEGPLLTKKLTKLFADFVWVEAVQRACDVSSGALLNREQFNVRNRHIGSPSSKDNAWAQFTENVHHLQTARGLTFRPGSGLFVDENMPGLTGECLNTWRPSHIALPVRASDDDVKPWIDHLAYLVPDEAEFKTILDWMTWVVQNPGEKPNWAIVMGGKQGIGKDLLLEPLRAAIGPASVKEISASELVNETEWAQGCKLAVVEEMNLSERRDTMQRIKPLVAAPPWTIRVNIKFVPQFEIPNLLAFVFFTNLENALGLEGDDRRFYVTWSPAEPRSEEYYRHYLAWSRAGGAAAVARWLLDRDLGDFSAQGRAPSSGSKIEMRKASRSRIDECIEEGIADGSGVFGRTIVTVGEVWDALPEHLTRTLSKHSLGDRLRSFGARRLAKRHALGAAPAGVLDLSENEAKQATIYALRDFDLVENMQPAEIKELFWREREQKSSLDSLWAANDQDGPPEQRTSQSFQH